MRHYIIFGDEVRMKITAQLFRVDIKVTWFKGREETGEMPMYVIFTRFS
jgi:hypothetical protein